MYVYRTSNFNDELKKYQDLSSRVANFCSKLEKNTFFEAQEKFKIIHGYLKRKEGNFRLIAKIIKVKKEPILCFLKVYVRGEPEYRKFLEIVKHQNFLFHESDLEPTLRTWLTEQKNNHPQSTNLTLKEDLRIWLQRPNWKINTKEIIIHETELWSEKFAQSKIRAQASFYRRIIENLIEQLGSTEAIGSETSWDNIYYYGQDNFYIIYSNIQTLDEPQEQVLLLIAPIFGIPDRGTIQNLIEPLVLSHTKATWYQKHHDLLLEDLITYTKRSYPGYLVLDENFWFRIQEGNGVNLALSSEEKELLHSVSTTVSLPLFLNGRAGSGKSTMLFYLFAYYCHRHLQFCRENGKNLLAKPHPLFITYSPSLSDFAKVKVQSLLKHHHHFIEETDDLDKLPNLGIFFKSFRSFLLKLLPPSARAKFTEDNYVSFHRFRELLGDRNNILSPEKCWLVIQNFIKGYELITKDTYLEATERYRQIPKKERTVTVEEFSEIRDQVWSWYHKYTQDRNLWDDRDLVRTILDLGYYKPEYTVIFCDEAQDFTRLELQLIMKLSVFSLYDLERETIFSLPFAFAGDPLQTLNPTGFRWASFKAAFYDEVLTPLNLLKKSQVELRLKQLEYNYRSAAAIVKVNNLIQLWRKILFNFTDIEPQKAKKHNNFIPQKFIIGDNITLEHLQDALTDTIILIPCDEGAEKEFIFQDELLRSFCENATTDTPWNILSAISAKGLEFKQVILYRFGEACTINLSETKTLATEEDKYFLNKLYVAASRATEKLFIIDSLNGEIKLWSYASDRGKLARFLAQVDDLSIRQQWQENIELITLGTSLSDLSNNNLEADALTFETVGINTENINLLNRAIAAYQKSQNKQKANFCLAWKLKFERNYLAAGELFLSVEKITESWLCFWEAEAWKKLQKLITLITNEQNLEIAKFKLLFPLIDFMVKVSVAKQQNIEKVLSEDIIEITDFLNTELQQNYLIEERDSQPWQVFLNSYSHQIQQLFSMPHSLSQDYWLIVANILINYLEEKTNETKQLIAYCLYFGRNYDRAIQYWEDIDDDDLTIVEIKPKYYYLAQAKLTTLPQGLQYLYQGKQYKIIITQWLKLGAKLEPDWLEYVALAFEAIEETHYALTIYCHLNDYDKVKQCWKKVKNQPITSKQAKQLVNYYLKQQYWSEAIDFAREKLDTLNCKCYFVYRLANSKLTPDKITKSQRQNYQKFIEQYLLANSQWQQYLTVEQLGLALEKIGSFGTTLTFYEQYVNSNNKQLQTFARDRWLVTKKRQVEYFSAGINLAKVQKTQQKLALNAQKWNLDLKDISLQLPVINPITTARKSLSLPQQELSSSSFAITGLPQNTKTKTLTNNIQQFQFKYLLLRIARATEQIVIVNLLNRQVVLIDWRKGKIQRDTVVILASGNQPLYFSDTQGKYKGILWRDLNPRLELKLDNHPTIITIKFRPL